jgi:hypothetical protein
MNERKTIELQPCGWLIVNNFNYIIQKRIAWRIGCFSSKKDGLKNWFVSHKSFYKRRNSYMCHSKGKVLYFFFTSKDFFLNFNNFIINVDT